MLSWKLFGKKQPKKVSPSNLFPRDMEVDSAKKDSKPDATNPDHYKQGTVECIDALESATIGLKGIEAVCTANTIKYLWRWKFKNGLEDLKKARWYLGRLIAKIEKQQLKDANAKSVHGKKESSSK